MPKAIDKFTNDLDLFLSKQAADVYFVQIDNLPVITLAKGHLATQTLIDELRQTLDGYLLMSDQIYFFTPAAKAAEIKKTISETSKKVQKINTHIAVTINHLNAKHKEKATNVLNEIYSRSMRENTIFSVSNKDSSNDKIKDSKLQIDLAKQIKEAISKQKFKLAYQPIIEAQTGKISHYEALLRIEDADGKLKSAGSFIPIAEKMGLIDSIDLYVLEMVVNKLKSDKTIKIAFNISNLTIGNREWIKAFFEQITPDIGKRMVIEITETTALRDLRETAYFIATLQDAGCMFALDDFGSGYTSFRQIRALSFDYIKIDGSLISDIATNQHNRLLVKSLLEYMRGMGTKTVAEFVENGEIAKILMEFGIDYMQGNYFGSPEKL